MEVIIKGSAGEACSEAARFFAKQIREKPNSVLGLATGGTPLQVYAALIRLHREEALDFSNVTTFNLDEYVGLAPDHPCSYRHFMEVQLFKHINIKKRANFCPGRARDKPSGLLRPV